MKQSRRNRWCRVSSVSSRDPSPSWFLLYHVLENCCHLMPRTWQAFNDACGKKEKKESKQASKKERRSVFWSNEWASIKEVRILIEITKQEIWLNIYVWPDLRKPWKSKGTHRGLELKEMNQLQFTILNKWGNWGSRKWINLSTKLISHAIQHTKSIPLIPR